MRYHFKNLWHHVLLLLTCVYLKCGVGGLVMGGLFVCVWLFSLRPTLKGSLYLLQNGLTLKLPVFADSHYRYFNGKVKLSF